jgi:mevalonate kinase
MYKSFSQGGLFMAVVLKNTMYKAICSCLVSKHKEYKSNRNLITFARALQTYPSKSIYCLAANRLIHHFEQSVFDINLIIELERNEGDDEELVSTIETLMLNPTIKSLAEVNKLVMILADYVKFAKILKVRQTFLKCMDMINEDDDTNIHEQVESMYKVSTEIVNAYNSVNVTETSHAFDTSDKEQMKNVMAEANDSRKPDKIIITGIRMLNMLLSPGYMSGCLYIFQGLPGNYKSGILLKSFVDCLRFNAHIKKVLGEKTPIAMYISMENTMSQTVLRLWSLLFPTADITSYTVEEQVEMIDRELCKNGMRSVILYYGYREKSAGDIANILRAYNDENNEVVFLALDYIKRMRPTRTDAAANSSEKTELHAIMNEIKSMICVPFNIPVLSGHQLNRAGAAAVDQMIQQGGFNRSDEALGRSNTGSAWEVVEVADWMGLINIENNGETKCLMIKAAKQREINSAETDTSIVAIRHPFIAVNSFALRDDINENCSISVPVYLGKRQANFMAAV